MRGLFVIAHSREQINAVFFRTDASIQMGTGHVMRCLNLASELKIFNSEIYFIVRSLDGNLNNRIEDLGYKVFLLEKLSEKKMKT